MEISAAVRIIAWMASAAGVLMLICGFFMSRKRERLQKEIFRALNRLADHGIFLDTVPEKPRFPEWLPYLLLFTAGFIVILCCGKVERLSVLFFWGMYRYIEEKIKLMRSVRELEAVRQAEQGYGIKEKGEDKSWSCEKH